MWAAKLPATNGALSLQFLITSTAKGDCNVILVTDGWLTKNNVQQHFGEFSLRQHLFKEIKQTFYSLYLLVSIKSLFRIRSNFKVIVSL